MTATDRAAELLADRFDYAREVAAGVVDYEVPAEVLDRYPGFRPTDPSTWPDPDRCVEGRPWGVDPWPTPHITPAARWSAWLRKGFARPCRSRWRDEATRLCGTHLNAYRRSVDEAERRLRQHRAHVEGTELARQLGAYGIEAQPGPRGVELTRDAARALLGMVAVAVDDHAALLDLVDTVERVTGQPGVANLRLRDTLIPAATERAREHLARTTPRPTPTTGD